MHTGSGNQPGKEGQEGHLKQRRQPGKGEKAQGVDTERALSQHSFVQFQDQSPLSGRCVQHHVILTSSVPYPCPQLDVIPLMTPEAREAQRG